MWSSGLPDATDQHCQCLPVPAAPAALALVLHRLGYPTPVPSDLRQRPNFEFVADCFAWLCQRWA